MTIDLEADAAEGVPQAPTTVVLDLANELVVLERRKAELDTELKAVNIRIRELEFAALPTAMTEGGMAGFTLASGWGVKVEPSIEGTVPTLGTIEKEKDPATKADLKARREFVLAWLRNNDHGGIIKSEVAVAFGKGEDKEAQELVVLLRNAGLTPVLEDTVAPQTYSAWLRDLSKQGELLKLPLDKMGVKIGTRAQLIKPKK